MLYGIIEYEEKRYIYHLEDNHLYMEEIGHLEKRGIIFEWFNTPPNFQGDYLRGINAENGRIVLFKTYPGNANFENTRIKIKIQYYIELQKDTLVNKISIMGDEIDYIYDISEGIEYILGEEGTASCRTKSFEDTTSGVEQFSVWDKQIGIYFTINRGINFRSCLPLSLHSTINLLFEETADYDFLAHLCMLIKNFLGYICYRKNINLSKILLYERDAEEKYRQVGQIFFFDKTVEKENEKIIKNRNITYQGIKGNIANIIQDIEDKKLYIRHMPDSYKDSLKIDHSKFIMVTAALEWLFKSIYPDGLPHSDKKIEAQEKIKQDLTSRISETTGEIKQQYKFLLKLVGSDSLSQKIVQMGKDYDKLIKNFGEYLYNINNQKEDFIYSKIGQRVERQRNNFAHGNLDKEFEKTAVLDLIYLERVVYAIQLSRYNIRNDIIVEQVKRLFGMSF